MKIVAWRTKLILSNSIRKEYKCWNFYFLNYPTINCIKNGINKLIYSKIETTESMCEKRELHQIRIDIGDILDKFPKNDRQCYRPNKIESNGSVILTKQVNIEQNEI